MHLQYTSRAAQMYKQQLEKDVAKFDTAAYLSGLKGKAAEPAAVTAAVKEADKEAVATNGNGSSRASSQNGSASNLAAMDDSSVEGAPASSTVSVTSAQGDQSCYNRNKLSSVCRVYEQIAACHLHIYVNCQLRTCRRGIIAYVAIAW